jgi:Centriolar protein SAS N-terminal
MTFAKPDAQALRVWLSNEGDACFLHTLDVGEDDFAGLKAQQGILVDFGGFPNKLIALLDRCAAAAAEHQPPRCCVASIDAAEFMMVSKSVLLT